VTRSGSRMAVLLIVLVVALIIVLPLVTGRSAPYLAGAAAGHLSNALSASWPWSLLLPIGVIAVVMVVAVRSRR